MDTLFILKDKFAEDQKKQNDDSITKIENSINGYFNILIIVTILIFFN